MQICCIGEPVTSTGHQGCEAIFSHDDDHKIYVEMFETMAATNDIDRCSAT